MAGETLREFLVALGFQLDENSFSKFETGLGRATAGALELGEVVVATAVAVETAVARMSRQFEDLFYQSQRTGSAVRAIQGFEYAARTVGVSSSQAMSAVEGLARAMRSNPGIGALLGQLGVRTQGRGAVEILGDVIGQLRRMPFYLAQQYGQTLGIDGDTLLMLISRYDELRRAQVDYEQRQRAAGVDAQKLASDSRAFGNALRALETTLGLIADRILQDFIGPVTNAVTLMDHWAQQFIDLDRATSGWATTLATVGTTALAAWLAKLLLARVLFRGAAAEAAVAATAAGAGGAAAGAGGAAAAAGGASVAGSLASGGVWGLLLGALGLVKYDKNNVARDWIRGKLGIREDLDKNDKTGSVVDFFQSQGWSREQAVGIAANLNRESGLRAGAIGDSGQAYGVAQWHGDRQQNFKNMFGKDIRESTLEEQLQFVQAELTTGAERAAGNMLRRAGSPEQAAAIVSKFYERPANAEGEALSRGGEARQWYDANVGTGGGAGGDKNVTIHANTKIDVSSTDPKQAAREIHDKQNASNAQIVRYAGDSVR